MPLSIVSSLNRRELKAAQLVAEDELTEETIAAEVGVNRRTLQRWKDRPDFANHVGRLRVEIAAALKAEGIRRRENRLAEYQDRHDRLKLIVEERARDPLNAFVPGWKSGFLTHDVKFGPEGEQVHLYKVDTGLLAAFLALEKQIAQDVGQWSEKDESALLGKKGTTVINTVYVGVPRPDFGAVAVQQVVEIEE